METDQVTERGIVLSTSDLKEYDRRLVVLTQNLGKITVFANNARRPNGRFGAISQSFAMGRFVLHPGRGTYSLREAEVEEPFRELADDPERYATASYVTELTEYFTRENLPAKDELNLLYVTYKTLLKYELSPDAVRAAFVIKLLHVEGVAPVMETVRDHEGNVFDRDVSDKELLDNEALDNETSDKEVFDKSASGGDPGSLIKYLNIRAGGLVLLPPGRGNRSVIPLSDAAVYGMQYIYSRPIGATFSFKTTEEVEKELLIIADSLVKELVDQELKAAGILREMREFRDLLRNNG